MPASEALVPGQRYFWAVNACNGSNCSAQSGSWQFFVTPPAGAPGFVTQSGATTSTTPTLSWSQPTGATVGSTVYVVAIIDDATGNFLPTLPPTTALSTTVPVNEGLVYARSYDWAVNACNGNLCSDFGNWNTFSTASTPGTPLESTPANGATNQTTTPTLTWTIPSGGASSYYVSLYDPYGDPAGHRLGDIAVTPGAPAGNCTSTACSVSVPASEGLLAGQSYSWNVSARNGGACSGYNGSGFSFTTAQEALKQASGASNRLVVNGDFAGGTNGATSVPGWTAGGSGFSVTSTGVHLTGSMSATPVALNFASAGQNIFRLGFSVPTGSALAVTFTGPVGYSQTQFGAGPWSDYEFGIPTQFGSPVTLSLSVASGTSADIAYIERLDVPSGWTLPRLGLSGDARLPRPAGGPAGLGVDPVTGNFGGSVNDLSVPGIAGPLSFSRAYDTAAIPQRAGVSTSTPLGAKWTHSWQAGVYIPPSSDVAGPPVTVRTPGGGSYTFLTSGSSYVAPPGVDATFTGSASTGWTLTTEAQTVYSFTGAGRLTSVQDRNGNTTSLTYDGSGNLTQVKDNGSGRYLTLTYSGSLITSVSDNAGRSVSYGYTNGDLTSATNVLGGTTTYTYTGHLLTGVTDPLGHVVLTNSYDASNRVATQQDAGDGTTRGTITWRFPALVDR